MKEQQTLGQLELEALKIVWDKPGSSVNEITETLLQHRDFARTTVLTIVQRLHKKGFLTRKKKDGAFRYFPTDSRESVMGGLTKRFIENAFDGSASSLVQHLAQTKLSAEELTQMRSIIDQAMNDGEAKS